MPKAATRIMASGRILGGLALVENAYDQPALIRALRADEIMAEEPQLLGEARKQMPSLPVRDIDLLIVDYIGKEISGTGMDPDIIGRLYIRGEDEPDYPQIKTIVARDLTSSSHGNSLGTGLADVITRRLFEKIDFSVLNENVYAGTFLERAKIPVVADNDEEAVQFAL